MFLCTNKKTIYPTATGRFWFFLAHQGTFAVSLFAVGVCPYYLRRHQVPQHCMRGELLSSSTSLWWPYFVQRLLFCGTSRAVLLGSHCITIFFTASDFSPTPVPTTSSAMVMPATTQYHQYLPIVWMLPGVWTEESWIGRFLPWP